ncbi:MAG: ribosomal protein L13e [Candidatus Thorarchaeota archaeon]|nr:ribosomal protein L13e [Candidatus Thorarchaeota archaeon]
MGYNIRVEPSVKSPTDLRPKRGRGFTQGELKAAELTVKDARDMGLMVDLRRKTHHEVNVEALKQYVTEMEAFVEALVAEESKKPDASDAIAVLTALKSVKKSEAELLITAGIKSIEDLAYCEIDKVAKKTGIADDRLTVMVKAALNKV